MTLNALEGQPLSDSVVMHIQRLEIDLANMRADRDGWRSLAFEFRKQLDEKALALVRVADLLAQWQREDRHEN